MSVRYVNNFIFLRPACHRYLRHMSHQNALVYDKWWRMKRSKASFLVKRVNCCCVQHFGRDQYFNLLNTAETRSAVKIKKMASLWESYEQQYSSLTAEIVNKTGKIPNLTGSECPEIQFFISVLWSWVGKESKDRTSSEVHINCATSSFFINSWVMAPTVGATLIYVTVILCHNKVYCLWTVYGTWGKCGNPPTDRSDI